MPEYTDYAHIPIPLWPEADQVPVDLKEAFKVIDPKLVLHATDQSDLPSLYPDVPAGTLVVGTSQEAMWIRRQDGSWSRVWSDSGWKTVTLTGQWGNVSAANPLSYRVIGAVCYWRGTLRQPDNMAAGTWTKVCNVPAEAQPNTDQRFAASSSSTGNFSQRIYEGEYQYWDSDASTGTWLPCPPPYIVAGA